MARKTANPNSSDEARWQDLTWDDLEEWAGSRSLARGRSYQRSGHVRDLARSADGVLVAWVDGQQRYATRVELKAGPGDSVSPSSRCTCPLGIDGCKHGVAVVVAYLDAIKKGAGLPIASAEDRRWQLLEDEGAEGAESQDENFDDAEEEDGEEEGETIARRPRRGRPQPSTTARAGRSKRAEDLRSYLEGLPVADLATYILTLAERYPEIARQLASRSALARGATGDLIRQARKEITRLTSQSAWYNHWSGEGELPDYSELKERFEQLLTHGQADALLDLGERLYESGQQQINSSHDEGETASAIGDCLTVVFRAVPSSSRPDADKLLFVLGMLLRDDFQICHGADEVLDHEWPSAVWSRVADELAERLRADAAGESNDFSRNYRRDALSNWLIHALSQAGREEEVLPLCEAEARLTGSYERLVEWLIMSGRLDEAKRWALEGIERTEARWPGIANRLREKLRDMAERESDWLTVAAYQAEQFFAYPTVDYLDALQQAADKAGCGSEVRAVALHFLETGVRPTAATTKAPARHPPRKKATAPRPSGAPVWPLPDRSASVPVDRSTLGPAQEGPHFNVLLELALQEKRPEDVLHWYDRLTAGRRATSSGWGGMDSWAGRVADAVADTQPERALALYRQIIESCIARTSPSAYEAARPYLRKLQQLLQRLGRHAEWSQYLTGIRETNRRKRRLLDVLDRLDGRRIVDG